MFKRLLVKTILLMTCVNAVAITLSMSGRSKPFVVAQFLEPGNCAQPCWHGIQPGKTTMAEARTILDADAGLELQRDSVVSPEWRSTQAPWGVRVVGTYLVGDLDVAGISVLPDVQLGDLVLAFGQPIGYRLQMMTDSAEGIVYFENHIQANVGMIYFALAPPYTEMLPFTPKMSIHHISYSGPDSLPCKLNPWPGYSKAPPPTIWRC